jgi:hypothetical protein
VNPRPAPGFPGLTVSDDGTVHGPSGQPLKRSRRRNSLFVPCSRGAADGRKSVPVGEVVCTAFHGPRPSPDHWCKNLSGSMYDNRPENVAWVLKRSAQRAGA